MSLVLTFNELLVPHMHSYTHLNSRITTWKKELDLFHLLFYSSQEATSAHSYPFAVDENHSHNYSVILAGIG